jgi:rubrerythrin
MALRYRSPTIMLITFKSAAEADVLMLAEHARPLLKIIGKDGDDPKGIVTVEQLPDAITRLRAAIEADKARHAAPTEEEEEAAKETGQTGMAAPVTLAQRAYPLLALMESSLKEKAPVTWGV